MMIKQIALVTGASREFGRLDILVNNAGTTQAGMAGRPVPKAVEPPLFTQLSLAFARG
jgi:NAD(P)-dependent dehydrogenase (short-subunit alcohol dehydrogenase family)